MKKYKPEQDPIATYGTGVPQELSCYLEAYAEIYARALHRLHRERKQPEFDSARAKREFLVAYGINARQFNGVRIDLDGKERSAEACHKLHLEELEAKITALQRVIQKLQAEPKTKRVLFGLHQKQRRLETQEARLRQAQARGPRLAFGSGPLFRHQFNLEAAGYRDHAEWLVDWRKARTSSFMLVGSKDETAGNSCAQLSKQAGTYTLKLRVAPGLVQRFGTVLEVRNLRFRWNSKGQNRPEQDIDYTLDQGLAVTVRFCRGQKKSKWLLYLTVTRNPVALVSDRANGSIGVDVNNGVLDSALVDPEGNLKSTLSLWFRTSRNANQNQAKASVEASVNEIVDSAALNKVPIVLEKLDFSAKKKAMRDSGLPNRAILSGLIYAHILQAFRSRGQRLGVEIISVIPAYSSVIGYVKFQSQYGLNSGTAAALVLARRSQKFSERFPRKIQVTLGLPVDSSKHVWTCWAALYRKLRLLKKNKPRPTEQNLRHLWFRTKGALSPAEVMLRDLRSSSKAKAPSAPRETRGPNLRQHRSAGV